MGSGPKPPDPYATAAAQGNQNYQTAQQNVGFSNANVNTPYGSSSYTQSGWTPVYDAKGQVVSYSPQYTQTIKLSPEEEALRQQNTQLRSNMGNLALTQSGQLQGLLGQPLSTASMQKWTTAAAPGDIRQDQTPTDRPAIEDAMMRSWHRSADPANAAEQAAMAARGMNAGGQGWGQMMQGQRDALSAQADQAYLASGQESRAAQEAYNAATQQKYQMGADWAAQMNNLRQAQLTEGIQLRDQPIKEMMTLMGGSAPNTPQFQSFQGQQMSAPNIQQAIYDNYNAKSQQYQNNLSGLFNLGSGALGMFKFGAGALPFL